jgi:pimeloyl-ACP methyl ester carboxylesterase
MNWLDVNGTVLRYELSGSGKTTLVLVHEMGGTLDSWDQVLPALNHARQVLRYDTRGAGLSEKIDGKVTFDHMADDLAALLDAIGITDKIAIVGAAVGAAIAIHFAVRHAARVGAMVVTSPPPASLPIADRQRWVAPQPLKPRACVASPTKVSPTPTRRKSGTTPRTSASSAPAGWPMTRRVLPPSIACSPTPW